MTTWAPESTGLVTAVHRRFRMRHITGEAARPRDCALKHSLGTAVFSRNPSHTERAGTPGFKAGGCYAPRSGCHQNRGTSVRSERLRTKMKK